MHPGVVRLLDSGEDGFGPWVATAWVDGDALSATFCRHLGWPGTFRLLADLAGTLEHLHGEGVVHGDLASRHVLVSQEHRTPVLIDFNMARRLRDSEGRESLQVAGQVLGTPAYLAPEVMRGALSDRPADVYSFGCIAHECAVGAPPFCSRGQTVSERLSQVPPALPAHVPGAFAELVQRCLSLEPKERPDFASLREALERLAGDSGGQPSPSSERSGVGRPPLVGRRDWVRSFHGRIRELQSGRGGMLALSGESGIGKTRLLSELGSLATRMGVLVLAGECPAGSAISEVGHLVGAPLSPLRALLDEAAVLCASLKEPHDVLGPDFEVLCDHHPALTRWSRGLVSGRPEARRVRTFQALWRLIQVLGQRQPVLLLLDDLQWGDDLTLAFLRWLREEELRELPVLIAFGFRSDERSAELDEIVEGLEAGAREVGRLRSKDVQQLVEQMLGPDQGSEDWLRKLVDETGGQPFYLVEYLRSASEQAGLGRAPTSVAALLDRHLERAGHLAGNLVQVASAFGRESELELLGNVLGWAPEDALDAGARLEKAGLATLRDGTIRFVHDRLHAHAYEKLDGATRKQLHDRIATKLLMRSNAGSEVTARHLLGAGRMSDAVPWLERAAEEARGASAILQSRQYLRLLCELSVPVSGERRARWWRLSGDASYALGELAESERCCLRALELLGKGWPKSDFGRASALAKAAVLQSVNPPRPSGVENTMLREAALANTRLAMRYLFSNNSVDVALAVLNAVSLGQRSGPRSPSAEPLAQLGYMSSLLGWRGAAERYFGQAEQAAAASGDLYVQCRVHATRSAHAVGRGEWSRARQECEKAVELAGRSHDEQELGVADTILSYIDYHEDALGTSARRCQALLERSQRSRNRQQEAWAHVTLARVFIVLGRHEDALNAIALADAILPEVDDTATEAFSAGLSALALGELRRHDASAEATARLERLARTNASPIFNFAEPLAFACEAAMLLPEGMQGRARLQKQVLAVMRKFSRVFPVGEPYFLFYAGWKDWQRGRRRAALRRMHAALDRAGDLGMRLAERRIRERMAALGTG